MSVPVGTWLPGEGRALIGVVHLGALPGAPSRSRPLAETIDCAVRDARAWEKGGADALLVENFGDAPFFPGAVPAETVASVTAATIAVGGATDLPVGVNVLRNDGAAALAAAVAAGGRFIRVNVLTHAYVTDQGIIEGRAHELLRRRAALSAPVSILADLLVKHATPLAPIDPVAAAREMLGRGGADALIVTGPATGEPIDGALARKIAAALPGTALFAGSGVTAENATLLPEGIRGVLVATSCEVEGRIEGERVRRLAARIHGETA